MIPTDSPLCHSPLGWLAALCAGLKQPRSECPPEEARQLRAAFHSLVDNLPLNLLIKDAKGCRVFVNRYYLRTHHLTLEQVLGRTDFDLFPEQLARKFSEDDAKILLTGEVLYDTEAHTTPDQPDGWIDRIKVPVRDADGEVVGVQVLFWDVTQRHRAERALERERYLLESLMNSIPDSIYFKDRHSRFIRISRAQADKFGLASPDEAIGRTDADIFTEEHARQALADEQAIMRTGRPMVARIEKETWPEQDDTWVSTTKMPLRDASGAIVGTFGISRDVTEMKRMEAQLREARDAADAANRAKSDFLANMSHEIRTPMNAIIGMTELLMDTELSSTQRDYLRMVQESGDSLMRLLNDILDFSKIEAGRLELDSAPFDVREALGDTMKSLATRGHAKGLELAFSIDPEVPFLLIGDPGRLRQVVVNLVGNAIKFTERGEVVLTVRCESLSADGAVLGFSVRDTGIGIAPEHQARVFEEFQQADVSTTRKYGGTGLGLAISSRLVALMGGRIWMESRLNHGSTFHFTAAFGVAEARPEDHRRRAVVLADTPVLVVDDNATNRRILFDVLSNWGTRPGLATGAREAFGLIREALKRRAPYRIVLLDVNMPEADGFEFASWVRDDPELTDTPLVMLTSSSRPGDNERRTRLRINAHLLKPVKQSELFDAMVGVLGVNESEDENEPHPAKDGDRELEGLRVLLAEDNPVNQKLAIGLLEKLGCEITVVGNGRLAVTRSGERDFDVVLMDVQMPEMDGTEAARAIRDRESGTGRHLPIVAMTAHAMTGDREHCLDSGMDDYLSKPVRLRDLADKLISIRHSPPTAPAPPPEPVVETSALIDWPDALDNAGGDRELLREILEAFLEECPSLIERIRSDVAGRDGPALRRSSHSLKGSLLTIGARPVAASALELERMGRAGTLDGCDTTLATLEGQLRELEPILRQGPPET